MAVTSPVHHVISAGQRLVMLCCMRPRVRPVMAALLFAAMLVPQGAGAAVDKDWTTAIPPFQIGDNLYYVGSRDLAAYLVTTPQGSILINANYTSSPPQIRHSVQILGFRWRDIRILLISHAHADHAGGAAGILRETGAKFEVMDGDADVMESGGKTDFAFGGESKGLQFPLAHVDRVLHDGDAVTLGGVTLIAHKTPGHTRGCTTWTTETHLPGEPAGALRHVVIGGSWSVLSDYRLLSVRGGKPASYPGIASDYTTTFSELPRLRCNVFLASHGSTFNMLAKLKRMPAEGQRVWIDPEGYKQAVAAAQQSFETAYRRESEEAEHGGSQ